MRPPGTCRGHSAAMGLQGDSGASMGVACGWDACWGRMDEVAKWRQHSTLAMCNAFPIPYQTIPLPLYAIDQAHCLCPVEHPPIRVRRLSSPSLFWLCRN